eukprot:CFRG8401T1
MTDEMELNAMRNVSEDASDVSVCETVSKRVSVSGSEGTGCHDTDNDVSVNAAHGHVRSKRESPKIEDSIPKNNRTSKRRRLSKPQSKKNGGKKKDKETKQMNTPIPTLKIDYSEIVSLFYNYNPRLEKWNSTHTQNKRMTYCYCGRNRRRDAVALYCDKCYNWYHLECVRVDNPPPLPFALAYKFVCRGCVYEHDAPYALDSAASNELYSQKASVIGDVNIDTADIVDPVRRKVADGAKEIYSTDVSQSWKTVLMQVIAILTVRTKGRDVFKYFSVDNVIIPFIDKHWDALWGFDRKRVDNWRNSVTTTLVGHGNIFTLKEKTEDTTSTDNEYQLAIDLLNLAPTTARVLPTINDHIINRNGYRYIDAEPDPFSRVPDAHRPCMLNEEVLMSMQQRAKQLKLSEDQLSIIGDRGYCLALATHCVRSGTYYYEVRVLPPPPMCRTANPTSFMPTSVVIDSKRSSSSTYHTSYESSKTVPTNAHVRLGWAQTYGLHQGPCGYDHFSYSYRDKEGSKFHRSQAEKYGEEYTVDDVIGCLIHIPEYTLSQKLCDSAITIANPGNTYKIDPKDIDMPIIDFKGMTYVELKDNCEACLKALEPVPGSYISFYKNGVPQGKAFTDINSGLYYPAVSLYMGAHVKVNFGPEFEFPPEQATESKTTPKAGTSCNTDDTVYDTVVNQSTPPIHPATEGTDNKIADELSKESQSAPNITAPTSPIASEEIIDSPYQRRTSRRRLTNSNIIPKFKPSTQTKKRGLDNVDIHDEPRSLRENKSKQDDDSCRYVYKYVPRPLSRRIRPMCDVKFQAVADMALSDILLKVSLNDGNTTTSAYMGPRISPSASPKHNTPNSPNLRTSDHNVELEDFNWLDERSIADRRCRRNSKKTSQ